MNSSQLRALCSKYADISRCRVVMGKGGKTRGFAFVRTKTPEGAARVMQMLHGFQHRHGGVPKRLKVAHATLEASPREPVHRQHGAVGHDRYASGDHESPRQAVGLPRHCWCVTAWCRCACIEPSVTHAACIVLCGGLLSQTREACRRAWVSRGSSSRVKPPPRSTRSTTSALFLWTIRVRWPRCCPPFPLCLPPHVSACFRVVVVSACSRWHGARSVAEARCHYGGAIWFVTVRLVPAVVCSWVRLQPCPRSGKGLRTQGGVCALTHLHCLRPGRLC